jgi:hypothetical protein
VRVRGGERGNVVREKREREKRGKARREERRFSRSVLSNLYYHD